MSEFLPVVNFLALNAMVGFLWTTLCGIALWYFDEKTIYKYILSIGISGSIVCASIYVGTISKILGV